MNLFLTSKTLINEEVTNEFVSFAGGLKKVVIVSTAAEYKEKNRNNIELDRKLKNLGFTSSFIDLEHEEVGRLREAEIVVLGGGNPYILLHHMQRTRADLLLKSLIPCGLHIMAISAGIFTLMKNLEVVDWLTPEMNTVLLKDKDGMHVIDEVVVPHYDRFISEARIEQEVIDKFEAEIGSQVVRLGEQQCMRYCDGVFNMIGPKMRL